ALMRKFSSEPVRIQVFPASGITRILRARGLGQVSNRLCGEVGTADRTVVEHADAGTGKQRSSVAGDLRRRAEICLEQQHREAVAQFGGFGDRVLAAPGLKALGERLLRAVRDLRI